MKKLFTLFVIVFVTLSIFAQPPQKMSYQSVIRNSSGTLVTNQNIGMKISILQGSATGTVVFAEIYNPNPQTNANGLVGIEIGSGTPLTGTFSAIDWANGPYYIKTETDPTGGTNYTISGTSQILSVPFALYAKKVETGGSSGNVQFNNAGALGGDTNLFWNNTYKRLGIGTTNPLAKLNVLTRTSTAINGTSSGKGGTGVYGLTTFDGQSVGIQGEAKSPEAYSGYFYGGKFFVHQNAGFGTFDPQATLDVVGTVKFGSSGRIFSEIREVTGTTSSINYDFAISYPGYTSEYPYTQSNTRVLSFEVFLDNSRWVGLGFAIPGITGQVCYQLEETKITFAYPYYEGFKGKPYRILLMEVQ